MVAQLYISCRRVSHITTARRDNLQTPADVVVVDEVVGKICKVDQNSPCECRHPAVFVVQEAGARYLNSRPIRVPVANGYTAAAVVAAPRLKAEAFHVTVHTAQHIAVFLKFRLIAFRDGSIATEESDHSYHNQCKCDNRYFPFHVDLLPSFLFFLHL